MNMRRVLAITALLAATTFGTVVAQVSPASAGSRVNVGGTATCSMVGMSPIKATSVRISASGTSTTVGTSGLFWKYGRYDLTLPYLPSQGTNGTMTVVCPRGSARPGSHSKTVWLKPGWRNTTGDTSWTAI